MSKRRSTTGLPKNRRKREEEEDAGQGGLFSRYIDETNREESIQRLVIIAALAVGGLLILMVVATLLWEQVIVPNRPVAVVNNETITVSEFRERVRLERVILIQRLNNDIAQYIQFGIEPDQLIQQEPYATFWQEITQQPELLGSRVLDDMIDEQIVRNQAAEMGITVDEAAVDEQVEAFFNFNLPEPDDAEATGDGEEATETEDEATATPVPTDTPTPFVSPTPSPTPQPTATPTPIVEETAEAAGEAVSEDVTPTLTPVPSSTPTATPTFEERQTEFNETIETFYANARSEANLSRAQVRSYFEYQALLEALKENVTSELSREATYVNARHILVETVEEAENVLAALEAGESFSALARAMSTDTGSGSQGGELGWAPSNNYVTAFQEAVSAAEIGAFVGPVESEFGQHVIQVRAREEREMQDNEYQQAVEVEFNRWLEDLTSEENNTIDRRDNWPNYVPTNPSWVYRPTGIEDPTTSS